MFSISTVFRPQSSVVAKPSNTTTKMRRRYFFLDEPLPSSEIPHMLLRIVKSRTSPLTSPYAPPSALEPTLPPIPLPAPLDQSDATLDLRTTRSASAGARLASLLHLHGGSSTGETARVAARALRRYNLPDDPETAFAARCASCPAYAAAARALLSSKPARRSGRGAAGRKGFLVVGFVTAVDAELARGTVAEGGGGADVAVPVAALAGVPLPIPGLDVGVRGGMSARNEAGVRGHVDGEVVLAVAYGAIALRRARGGGGEGEREVAVGDQVYAKAKHLGFASEDWVHGDDEDDADAQMETRDEFVVEDDELDLDDEAELLEFDS